MLRIFGLIIKFKSSWHVAFTENFIVKFNFVISFRSFSITVLFSHLYVTSNLMTAEKY